MDRPLKVATPPDAASELAPLRVPPAGFVPIETLTVALEEVTRLSLASRTRTVTAGEIVAPAVVVDGCTPKARCVAVPGVMLNVELVADVSPALAAFSV